ncbi:hypothetical protein RHSIM_RhsimUnG0123300 [Rhododendron simsii]|uniref:Uncharacterized protein n=1 Tax=Rhododendron simsii TaxID=118357 RepID=A0A834L4B3_RHOSS|nr:hypothetical protein RHSIM_RhsimUnG0123300 [Rhododendron simsii]
MFIREAASAIQKQLPKKQCTSTGSCGRWVSAPFLLLLVLLILTQSVLGGQSVKYLPGYGELPFELETGYISVNESELFYYFIPRKGTPQEDPIFLWLTGGPGCSSFNGLVYEFGMLLSLSLSLSLSSMKASCLIRAMSAMDYKLGLIPQQILLVVTLHTEMPTDIFHVARLPFDIKNWERCNKSLSYTKDIATVVPVHQELKEYGSLEVLVEWKSTRSWKVSIKEEQVLFVDFILETREKNIPEETERNMATERKANHYSRQLFPKNLLHDRHFNANSPLLSTLNVLQLLLVLVLCTSRTFAAFSQSIVKTLPGYAGDLPFKLETGYVSVGEWNDVHLFYYFIESEGNPELDPLILWLTGGPGCSGFCGLVYEIGPLHFDTEHFDGKFPNLTLNPFSWTKVASIIFLDAPVGTGFSYADNAESYVVDDLLSATDNYNFLLKWLMDHPTFLSNELYIGGDSYSGIIVPIVVQKIYEGTAKPSGRGSQSATVAAFDGGRGWSGLGWRLQGYILGNPLTSEHDDKNARIEFAHRLALLSDKLYESIKYNCHGEYITIDPNNAPCIKDLTLVTECLANLDTAQILEPNCAYASRNSSKLKWDRRFIEEEPTDLLLLPRVPKFWCRIYNYIMSYIWANDEGVRQALGIQKGTVEKWVRCNESLSYTEVVETSLDYHRNLSHTTLRALVYSGDHDMLIPYLGTHKWIESLNLTVDEEWRPWFVDGQNGGYTMSYVNNGYHLTFATIKARKKNPTNLTSTKIKLTSASILGGGHTAPEYKPKEAFAMIERWLAFYYL